MSGINTSPDERMEQLMKDVSKPPRTLRLSNKNQCLVISNKFANTDKELQGYKHDEKRIKSTFEKLNFDVKILEDLDSDEILNHFFNLLSFGKNDECFVLFILSHGEKNNKIFGADDNAIKLDSITSCLTNYCSLYGKPKLIFIQACRGHLEGECIQIPEPEPVEEEYELGAKKEKKIIISKDADLLVYYSTSEGKVSYVCDDTGSFFIQAVCRVFDFYAKSHPLTTIITKINEVVSRHAVEEGSSIIVECAEVLNKLTCDIWFSVQPSDGDGERPPITQSSSEETSSDEVPRPRTPPTPPMYKTKTPQEMKVDHLQRGDKNSFSTNQQNHVTRKRINRAHAGSVGESREDFNRGSVHAHLQVIQRSIDEINNVLKL